MRKLLIGSLVLAAAVMPACEEKNEAPAAPAPSATPSAAVSTTAAVPKPVTKPEEGPKDHAARAKAVADAWAAHDGKKYAAVFAEDALVTRPGKPDIKGRAEVEKSFNETLGAFKDAKLTIGRVWEKDKHTALMEYVFSGTNTGAAPEMGIATATNKPFGVVGAIWTESGDDGFIKVAHRYVDSPTILGQLTPDAKNPVRPVVNEPPSGTSRATGAATATTKGTPEEAANLEVENKWLAAVNAGKLDDGIKLVAKDVVFEDYTQPAAIKGDKAFKENIGMYLKAFPDMKATMTNSFTVGPFVVAEFEYTGTNKGPLGPIKATNKPVDIHQVEVDEIKDGKFVRATSWGNSAEMLKQMGIMPAPGAAAPPATPPAGKPAAKAP